MNRIEEKFISLKRENKKAVIPFITCGDLSIDKTSNLIIEMGKVGVSIVEIGIPFSDPLADGKVIQESYFRALKNGTKLKDVFNCVEKVRESSQIPIVLMVYFNIVFSYGVDKFLDAIREIGVDGLIVPDIPLEERGELKEKCERNKILLIPLVAPTSKARIKLITKEAKGFVYCVSSNGTTGERSELKADIGEYLNSVRESTNCPICLGFGISSRKVVSEVKEYCDGVIVGSAIVRRMVEDENSAIEFVKGLVEEINFSK